MRISRPIGGSNLRSRALSRFFRQTDRKVSKQLSHFSSLCFERSQKCRHDVIIKKFIKVNLFTMQDPELTGRASLKFMG